MGSDQSLLVLQGSSRVSIDPNGTTIPDIRFRLLEIAGDIDSVAPIAADRIRECVDHLYRRKPVRRTRARQMTPTDERRAEIRSFAAANPDMSEWDIGRRFGLNQGRISEALHGFRK
jgi:hypothetical protein